MGVPKFFRWISERYPCLSEIVKEYQIPDFDNLYLDMNGIIHTCSHPNDFDPHFRITEEKIFKDIFHYIEVLFRMIKPKKLFFLAVDGVAPRAKMNQQRGRRFRSAKEAEILERNARERGEQLPSEARFDSNCITPGTCFMDRLHQQLKYFVTYKVSTDRLWQNVTVILSGHETPGEGEHKIMDYIRYARSRPDHDPNTRHCLYGLDADLIMLGLCSHEPHFSLLREEVKFGRRNQQKRIVAPEETTFYLLHLSLMREYLEHEFSELKEKLPFPFDLEKIIDDWVLMGFLVGNDFIPPLPDMHITSGALPMLYKAYIDVLPQLGGYINEAGDLNLKRFEQFMQRLATFDVDQFRDTYADLREFEMKTGRRPGNERKSYRPDQTEDAVDDSPRKALDPDLSDLISRTEDMLADGLSDSEEPEFCLEDEELSTAGSDEEEKIFLQEFDLHKRDYYINKLEYEAVTPEVMRSQAEGYVRAIQWNLHYYYNGVCSWSWFYPHHYAPYVSDIRDFSSGLRLEYDMGKPFLPFQQLLAVLPTLSKNLLPEPYQHLMEDKDSPLISFYPTDFKTDLNGKKQQWEAVVLIPFINEEELLKAMAPYESQLTEEERKRNTPGPMLVYKYTDDDLGVYEAPEYFPPLETNHAKVIEVWRDELNVEKKDLIKGLWPGAKLDVYYPGFPTMKHIPHKAKLEKREVHVFDQPSRGENMILSIENQGKPDPEEVATHLLGKNIFVAWPHLVEARVYAVSNHEFNLSLAASGQLNKERQSAEGRDAWSRQVQAIKRQYMTKRGVEIGSTSVLVHAATLCGIKHIISNSEVALHKQWSSTPVAYALQTTVKDIKTKDKVADGPKYRTVDDLFPRGCVCFVMAPPHYGAMGEVKESIMDNRTLRLKITVSVPVEPDLSQLFRTYKNIQANYMTVGQAAQRLSISPHLLSRITGTVYVIKQAGASSSAKLNLGLNLKFNKRNEEVPGYTRKEGTTWLYSQRAVDVVAAYVREFPDLFQYLTSNVGNDCFVASDVFPGKDWNYVSQINTWIRNQHCSSVERRPCGSQYLEPEVGEILMEIVDAHQAKKLASKNVGMHVKPRLLYRHELQDGNLAPDTTATYSLLDRVINVREGYTVPLGLRGTIIGIRQMGDKEADVMHDVMFDEAFPGGLSLLCSEKRSYSLPAAALVNLSHGERQQRRRQLQPLSKPTAVVQPSGGPNLPVAPPIHTFTPPWKKSAAPVSVSPLRQQPNQQQGSAFVSWTAGRGVTSPQRPAHSQAQVQPPHQFPPAVAFVQGPPLVSAASKNPPQAAVLQENTAGAEFRALWNNLQKLPANNSMVPKKPDGKLVPKSAEVEDQGTELLKKVLRIVPDSPDGAAAKEKRKTGAASVAAETQTSPAKSIQKPSTESSCMKLLHMFQARGLGIPRYAYVPQEDGTVQANVQMPDNTTYQGECAANREQASESAARVALAELEAAGGALQFGASGQSWMQLHQKQQQFGSGSGVHHGKGAGVGALPAPPQQWFQNGSPSARFNQQPHGQWRSHTAADTSDRSRLRDHQGHPPKGSRGSPGWQHQHQHQQQHQQQHLQHHGRHGQGFQPPFGQGSQQQQYNRRSGLAEAGHAQYGPGAAGGLPPRLQNLNHHQPHQQLFQNVAPPPGAVPPRFLGQQAQPFVPLQAAVKSRAVTGRGSQGEEGRHRGQESERVQNSTTSVEQSPVNKSSEGNVRTPDKVVSTASKGSGGPAARKTRKVRIAARFTYGLDVDDEKQPALPNEEEKKETTKQAAGSDSGAVEGPTTEQN
ncbi:5'-3' exoribonuclease 1 [Schistocerca gregaria]|uniref:5'-3' exoribonuclease 1 n=1 Tax=Schistocerca gregaria TaxID=7010 RepID=UPI00211EAA08|nr:5'-3' exoribonuclease 1 [Schistocerca gregaria]